MRILKCWLLIWLLTSRQESASESPTKLDSLINMLAKENATFSTTIHLFGEKAGVTYFSNPGNSPDTTLNKEQKQRNTENFSSLMMIAKKMIDKGKKANLLNYDNSPFDDYRNFLSTRTIVKDGVVFDNSITN